MSDGEEEWMVDEEEIPDEMDEILDGMAKKPRPRWKRAARIMAIIAIGFLIADAGLAFASTFLFTHNLPATPSASAPAISTQCSAFQAFESTTIQGTAGTVLYSCSSSVPSFTTSGSAAIPSFSAPVGLALSVVSYVAGSQSCTGGTLLTPGSSISLASGGYDYCGSFSSYPSGGFPGFSVSWSQ